MAVIGDMMVDANGNNNDLPPDKLAPSEIKELRLLKKQMAILLAHLDFTQKLGILIRRTGIWLASVIVLIYGAREMFPWIAQFLIRMLQAAGP